MRCVVPNPDKAEAVLIAENDAESALLAGLHMCEVVQIALDLTSGANARWMMLLKRSPREADRLMGVWECEQIWGKE